MIDPAILRAMLNAGCTAEQIVAVVEEAARAEEERRREKRMKDAERQRRHRANKAMSRDVTHVTRDKCDTPSSEVSPHTPLPNSNPIPPSPPKGGSSPKTSAEFDEFWALYPHKVGKRKAEESFRKARKRASFDEIMAGLRRYVAKTDDRPWCNPATWLNQDRWTDAPAPSPQALQPPVIEDETRWIARLKWARERGIWSTAEWGPMPGMHGCRAPPHLLKPEDGKGWREYEQAA